jgi:voltage-gated potassium channel
MVQNKDFFNQKKIKTKPEGFSKSRQRLHEIIFEAETRAGRLFDIALLFMILASIITIMLESVPSYYAQYQTFFYTVEWVFTIFFTIEYLLRIYAVYSPRYYIFSFFGLIDLLSILPGYISLFIPGMQSLMIIRGLRLVRLFRIFKLDAFVIQGNHILNALVQSRNKLIVFALSIMLLVTIFGSVMYLVEHDINSQFDSIPRSIYWAIVTITTVGYGDMSPRTPFGQFMASIIMMMGYVIIAVPTGIVASSFINTKDINTETCPNCAKEGHDPDAKFCDQCGHAL